MYSISGTVFNAQSQPIEGAIVMISEGTAAFTDMAAVTDAAGTFRLGNLENGNYSIQASVEGKKIRVSVLVNDQNAVVQIIVP